VSVVRAWLLLPPARHVPERPGAMVLWGKHARSLVHSLAKRTHDYAKGAAIAPTSRRVMPHAVSRYFSRLWTIESAPGFSAGSDASVESWPVRDPRRAPYRSPSAQRKPSQSARSSGMRAMRTAARTPSGPSRQEPPRARANSPVSGPVGSVDGELGIVGRVVPVAHPLSRIAGHVQRPVRAGASRAAANLP
jgi:hypothetical protein